MVIAARTGAEIVSVDSMQVYRHLDIGTAKPSREDRLRVRHHMIDMVEPSEAYSVARFQEAGRAAMSDALDRGVRVLVVGGSGLHFRSLVDPLIFPPSDPGVRRRFEAMTEDKAVLALLSLDPEAGGRVDLANPRRVVRALEIHALTGATPAQRASTAEAVAVRAYRSMVPVAVVGIDPGSALADRVSLRLSQMLANGFLEEVRRVAPMLGETASAAVGYREMGRVVRGEWDIAYGTQRARDATMALARRQRTFHRRDPRITWLGWDDGVTARADTAQRALEEAGWIS
jgi:tRNA dimethylallyltransferase